MELVVNELYEKVLVARHKGQLYAVGAICPHGGAPLSQGAMFDDKVLCPWHGAGFSVTTGALEYAPATDGLPSYKVIESKDGKWYVSVPKDLKLYQTAPMVKRDPSNMTRMLIIGGGAAGLSCAETLRQCNFTGEIKVISNENVLPYDRVELSKQLASGDLSKFMMRSSDFLD